MKTKIDIFENDWCNLVFEGKNKEYGAFEIRTHAVQQQIKSILITIFMVSTIAILPLLLWKGSIVKDFKNDQPINISQVDPITPPIDLPKPEVTKPASGPVASIEHVVPSIVDNAPDNEKGLEPTDSHPELAVGLKTQGGSELTSFGDENFPGPSPTPTAKKIFSFVEEMPEFQGGPEAMKEFLKENLAYPSEATRLDIFGTVVLQFIVDEEGNLNNIKVIRGIGAGCDEEALRVVKLMGKWKPGRQNGHPVPVNFTLPLKFVLARNF